MDLKELEKKIEDLPELKKEVEELENAKKDNTENLQDIKKQIQLMEENLRSSNLDENKTLDIISMGLFSRMDTINHDFFTEYNPPTKTKLKKTSEYLSLDLSRDGRFLYKAGNDLIINRILDTNKIKKKKTIPSNNIRNMKALSNGGVALLMNQSNNLVFYDATFKIVKELLGNHQDCSSMF